MLHCSTGNRCVDRQVDQRDRLYKPACFLCPKPSSHAKLLLDSCWKKHKTDHFTIPFQFLHWLLIQQRIQFKINTLCCKYIMGTAVSYLIDCLQLYTHPPVLSTLLLILSASRFLTPDSPPLIPSPFLLCVRVYVLIIVSRNKILYFMNT